MEWVPFGTSALIAALIAPAGLRALPTRPNWLGRELPFPAGVLAAVAAILAFGVLAAVQVLTEGALLYEQIVIEEATGDRTLLTPAEFRVDVHLPVALLLGVALLGALDDTLSGPSRGWRGHAKAALRGEISTGALKALGTLALATAVLAGDEKWLLSVLLVTLTTNLFNILDLRPGRATKVFVAVGAGLLIAGHELPRVVGLFGGALLVVGFLDLRMRCMLGDTGSNMLGAMAGIWLTIALGPTGEAVALGVVLAITIYGELASITRTIERIPALRWIDGLGRPAAAEGAPTLTSPERDA